MRPRTRKIFRRLTWCAIVNKIRESRYIRSVEGRCMYYWSSLVKCSERGKSKRPEKNGSGANCDVCRDSSVVWLRTTRFKPPRLFCFPKSKTGAERWPLRFNNIQKSVTSKLKAFPISDVALAMKRLEERAKECVRVSADCFKQISITYFNFLQFFSPFSQHCRKTYWTNLVFQENFLKFLHNTSINNINLQLLV